jgi:hypothetical protein
MFLVARIAMSQKTTSISLLRIHNKSSSMVQLKDLTLGVLGVGAKGKDVWEHM